MLKITYFERNVVLTEWQKYILCFKKQNIYSQSIQFQRKWTRSDIYLLTNRHGFEHSSGRVEPVSADCLEFLMEAAFWWTMMAMWWTEWSSTCPPITLAETNMSPFFCVVIHKKCFCATGPFCVVTNAVIIK